MNISRGLNALPIELIINVMSAVLGPYGKRRYGHYTQLLRLFLVCKRWQTVIANTPSFWTVVAMVPNGDCILKRLEYSRNNPLEVHSYATDSDLVPMSAWENVCAVVHRWQHADLLVEEAVTKEVEKALEVTDLRLRSLSLCGLRHRSFTLSQPKLQHLANLQSLILSNVDLAVQNLLDILSSCRLLQYLDVRRTTTNPETEPRRLDPVTAPSMREMYLPQYNAATLRALLNAVDLPGCSSLLTGVHWRWSEAFLEESVILSSSYLTKTRLLEGTRAVIQLKFENYLNFAVLSVAGNILFGMEISTRSDEAPLEAWRWLKTFLKGSCISSTTLRIIDFPKYKEAPSDMFNLPSVTELVFDVSDPSPEAKIPFAFLNQLASLQQGQWRFPELKTLSLLPMGNYVSSMADERILAMVEARYGATTDRMELVPSDWDSNDWPCKLEKLTIRMWESWNKGALARIQSIVGDGVLATLNRTYVPDPGCAQPKA